MGRHERAWADNDPKWGIWGIAEAEAKLLPDDLDGLDVIELGCGTAYVSSWLARRGATVTGIDNSPVQLETAARLMRIAERLLVSAPSQSAHRNGFEWESTII